MQFLAQVRVDDVEPDAAGLLSIFMCQNDPGLCEEWDPVAGGNRAFVFGTDAVETPSRYLSGRIETVCACVAAAGRKPLPMMPCDELADQPLDLGQHRRIGNAGSVTPDR